jgi:urease accessory protein
MMKYLTLLAALLLASPAFAHMDPAEHGSIAAGFTHPLFGLDHVLAMIVVGLWAAQIGGWAIWSVPLGFVSAMLAGFLASLAGVPLPVVEPVILASSVILGLLVALAVQPKTHWAMLTVAGFALFHGHAHGSELGAAGALPYGAGFLMATIVLHAFGTLIGASLQRFQLPLRILGGGTALAGVILAVG